MNVNSSPNMELNTKLITKIALMLVAVLLSFTIIGIPISIVIVGYYAYKEIVTLRSEENSEDVVMLRKLESEYQRCYKQFEDLKREKHILASSTKLKFFSQRQEYLRDLKLKIHTIQQKLYSSSEGFEVSSELIKLTFASSEELKNKLEKMKAIEKEFRNNGIEYKDMLSVDSSSKKGLSLQKKVGKTLVKNFINEVKLLIKNNKKTCYTTSNLDKISSLIEIIYDDLNTSNENFNIGIKKSVLKHQVEKFNYNVQLELLMQEEKEAERERKEEEREALKAQKEIEKLIQKNLEEEAKAKQNLMEYELQLEQANDEDKENIRLAIDKWRKIVEKIAIDKDNIEEFAKNYNVGYVYVVENSNSFKNNILKIGMTRRPEPEKRFKELSNASVPFAFDPLILVKSENAFKLEKELHNTFANKRVNMVNRRKEYFHTTIEEIKNVLSSSEIPYDDCECNPL